MRTARIAALTGLVILFGGSAATAKPAADGSFVSPSKRITCFTAVYNGQGFARCSNALIGNRAAPTNDCPDAPTFVDIRDSGRVRLVKQCGAGLPPGTLAYGDSVRRGQVRCTSLQTGVRCTSLKTHHGFKLNARSLQRF